MRTRPPRFFNKRSKLNESPPENSRFQAGTGMVRDLRSLAEGATVKQSRNLRHYRSTQLFTTGFKRGSGGQWLHGHDGS